jgi:asparagine synthase (glutamine-hydrolysing)
MPGCCVTLNAGDIATKAWPQSTPYWRARDVALSANPSMAKGSDYELIKQTERQLQRAVGLRMVADVPLGAFLSGGIDSSVVVAMMQSVCTRPVKTFSIGFNDERYNEASHAALVAAHLGTCHSQLYVSEEDVLDVIRRMPALYDEPFADSSQIPTVLVSQIARAHVTVALSGDGGDELFGGYNRHTWVPRIWQMAGRIPQQLRAGIGSFLLKRTPAELDASFAKICHLLPANMHARTPGDKLHKLAGILGAGKVNEIYAGLVSTIRRPQSFMATPAAGTDTTTMFPDQTDLSPAQWMMLLDTENYMADDILAKVDRASMSVSLEARIPFLDPELYSWAWRLPMSMKIRDRQGKWVLRQVLYRHVPQALVDRPKTGFGIPLDALLRGPLQEWTRDVLNSGKLAAQNVLNPQTVQEALNRHMDGDANNAYMLWNLLVLISWIDAYRDRIDL